MAVVKVNTYTSGNNDLSNLAENVDANRLGIDLTHVVRSGATYLLKEGSIVEANGSLYSNTADIDLGDGTGFLTFNSATSLFSISLVVGVYDATKSGIYVVATPTQRVLKWQTITGGTFGIWQPNIGLNAAPTISSGLAIGTANVSTADKAFAIGHTNSATGAEALAIGASNSALAGGLAVGLSNTAGLGIAVGRLNIVSTGTDSVAFGRSNTSIGDDNSVLGRGNQAIGGALRSSAVGNANSVSGGDASAFGRANNAIGASSAAVGRTNTADGAGSSAFGNANTTNGTTACAFGTANAANGAASSAFGNANSATGRCNATGNNNTASALYASAVGALNSASGVNSSAMGNGSSASGEAATAMGFQSVAAFIGSSAFGASLTTGSPIECVYGSALSNVKFIHKSITQAQAYTSLNTQISSTIGQSAPGIFYESKTIGGRTFLIARPVSLYKDSSTAWIMIGLNFDETVSTVLATFTSGNATPIGINFAVLDIAR